MPVQMSFGTITRNDFTPAPSVDSHLGYRKQDRQIFNRDGRMVPLFEVTLPVFSNVFVRKQCQSLITNQLLVSFVTGKTTELHVVERHRLTS